jgi:hypothetical protein
MKRQQYFECPRNVHLASCISRSQVTDKTICTGMNIWILEVKARHILSYHNILSPRVFAHCPLVKDVVTSINNSVKLIKNKVSQVKQ